MAIEPHPGRIVNGLEAKERPRSGRDGKSRELTPVPSNSLVLRKDLLNDTRYRRPFSVVGHVSLPVGGQAFVVRVCTNLPVARSLDCHSDLVYAAPTDRRQQLTLDRRATWAGRRRVATGLGYAIGRWTAGTTSSANSRTVSRS